MGFTWDYVATVAKKQKNIGGALKTYKIEIVTEKSKL
jgi:hypothetical protein